MAQKQVLFLFQRPPHGTIHYIEGLRLAMGLATMGQEPHLIEVVFREEGAMAALQGVERGEAGHFLSTLLRQGTVPKAEAESLAQHGITTEEVASDIEVINRSQVRELISQADFVLSF